MQLFGFLAGIALATALWSAVQAINSEARNSYEEAAQQLSGGQFQRLIHPTRTLSVEDFAALRRAGWQVAPVLEGRTSFDGTRLTVFGVDFVSYPPLPALEDLDEDVTPLEVLMIPGRAFARPDLIEAIAGSRGLPELIPSENVPADVLLVDIGWAERLLGRPGQISYLVVLPDTPPGNLPLTEILPGLVTEAPDAQNDIAQLTESFHLNLTAFGFLAFAVGLFITQGTAGLAFEQRRPVFRTLRAIGFSSRGLAALVMAELTGLALLAGAVGLVLGYFVAGALLPEVAATLRGLYGAPVEDGLALRPIWIFSGLGIAWFGSVLASAQALWRLGTVPLLGGASAHGWMEQDRKSHQIRILLGGGLVVAGIAAPLLTDGLLAGFALLAGILMGAAILLLPALGWLVKYGQRFGKGPLGEWLWADMRVQLPSLSMALAALMLALAANVGVGTMVSSFRLTFIGWLDQRLASELYVRTETDAQGREFAEWVAPFADAVLPIRSAPLDDLEGAPGRIFGVADDDTYRDHWPLIARTPDAWDLVSRGDGVLINEQLARRQGLWPGERVALAPGWSLPVAGVYSDYGNPSGQIMIGLSTFDERFPEVPNISFAVRVAPNQAEELAARITDRFDLPIGSVVNQAALKQSSLAVFETTFVITGALNILTLGVAAVAMLTALLTQRSMRLPHLAPLWAMGLTRAELARFEAVRTVAMAGLTAVLALPLGLVLAWILLNVINVEAFGWLLPMYIFPFDWLTLFLLALATGWLSSVLPARRLRQTQAADLLKVFAHER